MAMRNWVPGKVRYAAMDLETVDDFPPSGNWWESPPRIAAVGIWLNDVNVYTVDHAEPGEAMSVEQLVEVARNFYRLVNEQAYTLATHNGMGFDLPLIAYHVKDENPKAWEALSTIALHQHIDTMLVAVCTLGHPLSLDGMAKGLGLKGKSDEMKGADAPKAWREGKSEEVLAYLKQDCVTTGDLHQELPEVGFLPYWIKKDGKQSPMGMYPCIRYTRDGKSKRLLTPGEMEGWPDVERPNWKTYTPFDKRPMYSWLFQ